MNDSDLNQYLYKNVDKEPKSDHQSGFKAHTSFPDDGHCILSPQYNSCANKDAIVVTEIPVSNTQLHNIATGKLCTLSSRGECFGVRFLLKNSFKSKQSNYVVRNMVMQIVALGKDNVMRKEDIATDIKIQTVKSKVVKKEEPKEEEVKVNQTDKELF
jgi:hypothetical protein